MVALFFLWLRIFLRSVDQARDHSRLLIVINLVLVSRAQACCGLFACATQKNLANIRAHKHLEKWEHKKGENKKLRGFSAAGVRKWTHQPWFQDWCAHLPAK